MIMEMLPAALVVRIWTTNSSAQLPTDPQTVHQGQQARCQYQGSAHNEQLSLSAEREVCLRCRSISVANRPASRIIREGDTLSAAQADAFGIRGVGSQMGRIVTLDHA